MGSQATKPGANIDGAQNRSARVQARTRLARSSACLVVLAALASCRAYDRARVSQRALPELRLSSIVHPQRGSASLAIRELEGLTRSARLSEEAWCAAKLRCAALHLELHDSQAALAAVRSVQERVPPPMPRARAIAGFLAGRAHLAEGRVREARASFDAARAASPTRSLRDAIGDALTQLRLPPPERADARIDASVLSRARWGARPARLDRMQAMGRPRRITIHHSALFCGKSSRQSKDFVRIFQRTHMEDRGWGDIGYHWLIDRDGHVLEGRDMRYQGAHAGDNASNRRNIGICLLGNFQPGRRERAQRPSLEQINSLERLVHTLSGQYSIDPSQILTHREVHPGGSAATLCPGVWLSPFVAALRSSMRNAARVSD